MYSTCVQNIEQCCITYCTLLLLSQVIVGVADPILGGDTEEMLSCQSGGVVNEIL